MQRETLLRLWNTNLLSKKRYDAVVGQCGSLDNAVHHMDRQLLNTIGCRPDTIERILTEWPKWNYDDLERRLSEKNIEVISIEDDAYPGLLKSIPDPPIFLSYRGDIDILPAASIALVGTRNISPYGKRVTELFVSQIVRSGFVTVSGLAAGIDHEVALQTLASNGRTIAVLGHGLSKMYPMNHARIASQIVDSGGLLLSEFALDFPPDNYTFPARNRIIAGISHATIILEAAEGSGSLITADLALDYNRDVFAVPGDIFNDHYNGCHQLIRNGHAQLVSSPKDVLIALGITPSKEDPIVWNFDTEEESILFDVLSPLPKSIDDISIALKTDASMLNATLTILELKGAAKNIGEGKWIRA